MFKKMYLLLFNRISDAIQAIERGDPAQARAILIRAQQDAEAKYIGETEE
ncbi:MAG: hypothetical protein IJ179_09840 [Oscillospiraceae bacterium]|nr:hypothetical protein [Oscillospiraceae bacterium]